MSEPLCPCAGACHHDKAPCSLGCWAAQKPWRVEEATAALLADNDRLTLRVQELEAVVERPRPSVEWRPAQRTVIALMAPIVNGVCTGCGGNPNRETGSCLCLYRIDDVIREDLR